MSRKQYTQDEVIRILNRKQDCKIDSNRRLLTINKSKPVNDLGNGSWGKIDFLTRICGFRIIYV